MIGQIRIVNIMSKIADADIVIELKFRGLSWIQRETKSNGFKVMFIAFLRMN